MSLRIKIYAIFFFIQLFVINESLCLSQKTITAQDSIIFTEDDAEIAFDNAKYYYQKAEQSLFNNRFFGIFRGISIFHFFSHYRKAEENMDEAFLFYKAIGDKEKLIALGDMSKKVERMIIIIIGLILLQFSSLFLLFSSISILAGSPISFVFPAAIAFLVSYLLAEPMIFKTKKMMKHEK